MSTRSDTIQVIGQEGAIDTGADQRSHVGETKEKGIFGRIKLLLGKVVTVEEDWILKSKDWPYLWNHKDTDNKE